MKVATGSISTYVFAVVRGRPQFLLLLRAPGLLHEGDWQAVHGMIDEGETAVEAARREMLEETGLTPSRFFRLDQVETFYSDATDAVHLVPMFGGLIDGLAKAKVSEEHTRAEWCDLEEALRRLVFASQRSAVRLIADAVRRWPDISNELKELPQVGA
jgi:dihydroneopterin triphosphate diphosphatase